MNNYHKTAFERQKLQLVRYDISYDNVVYLWLLIIDNLAKYC